MAYGMGSLTSAPFRLFDPAIDGAYQPEPAPKRFRRGVLDQDAPVEGYQPSMRRPGILDVPEIIPPVREEEPPRDRPILRWLNENQGALAGMSAGFLTGRGGFGQAMAGFQSGGEYDAKRRSEKEAAAERKRKLEAVQRWAESRIANGTLTPADAQMIQAYPELAGQFFGPQQGPDVGVFYTPEGLETRGVYDPNEPNGFRQVGGAKVPSPMVQIDQRSESAFEQQYGKGLGDQALATLEQGNRAAAVSQKAQLMGALLDQIESGKLAPAQATIGAWMQAVGIDPAVVGIDPSLPASAEAINALSNELVVGKIGGPGGFPANNFSEADRNFIVETVPRLANRPEAARIKLEVLRRLAQLDVDKANAWVDARAEGQSYEEFDAQWRRKVSATDIFADLAAAAKPLAGQQGGAIWVDPNSGAVVERIE